MTFAAFLGGSFAPVLLMLSPLAVMAASDHADWKPAVRAMKGDPASCTPLHWPLM
ncbi:hypothetical protein MOK15_14490 [Sphingobium sp. BYY-5]|uniref:hypothetical protein n=1 Tax=Sphingobium sp. BYY-5 TaxID=2926400 RepID=UPI001FA71A16|nr:hypothetical protein [Sphingobium sp. BYY-5]MCI4591295.1 hypothetical protein [Sphingobium sp. BYY-5]